MTYHIYYKGAPYGDDERGHVISTHNTLGAALDEQGQLTQSGRYYNNTYITDDSNRVLDWYACASIVDAEIARGLYTI